MKRKLFILCLTCLITISFIGCNDTTAVDTTTNTTAATTSLTTENTTTENTTTVTTSATTTTVTTMATTTVVVDYTLTFNSNQGTACSPIVGNVGVGITLPIPTRTGYFFAGWFTDALFTTPFQDDVMPSVDLMLYAKWMTSAEVTAFLTSLNESTQLSFDMETTVNIDGAEESHSLVEYHRNGDSIKIITLDDSPMYTSGYTIYIVKSDDTYMSFRKQDCEDCTACWTRSEESIFDITNNQSYLLSRFSQAMPDDIEASWFDFIGNKMVLKDEYLDDIAVTFGLGLDAIFTSYEIETFLNGVQLMYVIESIEDDTEAIVILRGYDVGTTVFEIPSFDVCVEYLFDYGLLAGGIEITGYFGNPEDLIIPETIGNEIVVAIAEDAFSGYSSLKSVVIPKTIVHIGNGAFATCPNLESVFILSTTPPTLGTDVFLNASSTLSITVPSSSLSTYQTASTWLNYSQQIVAGTTYTVSYNANGGTLIGGSQVQTIDEGGFAIPPVYEKTGFYLYWDIVSTDINADVTITAQWSATPITAEGLSFTLKSDDTYEVSDYTGTDVNVSIQGVYNGKAVTSIGMLAFSFSAITKLTMPNSITLIEDSAFYNCSNLEEIILSSQLVTIERYAFLGNSKLVSIDIPDYVIEIGDHAFINCTSLMSISLPSSLEIIGDSAFVNCSSLVEIEIPEGVTSIGEEAFARCRVLTTIDVNSSNTAFTSINGVLYDITGTKLLMYPVRNSEQITFNPGTTVIGTYAFDEYSAFLEINIPSTVTTIEELAFMGNNHVQAIYIPSSVTEIKEFAFIGAINATIYYEGASIPATWNDDWNPTNLTIVFNTVYQTSATISFESNGGSAELPITQLKGSVLTELPSPTKLGYSFMGWYYDIDCYVQSDLTTMPYVDITLYAKWEESVAPADIEIALITDVRNIDDKSYNEATWNGVVQYATEHDITYAYYRPTEDSNTARISAIEIAISKGAKIVICPGWLFETAVYEVQDDYPEVAFLVIDGTPHTADFITFYTAENTHNILYQEEQSGFLAGYAAVMNGYRDLGFVGGMAVPAVVRYGFGFIQGAEYAADELNLVAGTVTIKYYYANAFEPSPQLETKMDLWYSSGTEVVFACGGGLNLSIIAAAENTVDGKVIGVDVDQVSLSETILTSAMKGLTSSVVDALTQFYDNSMEWPTVLAGETSLLGAANDGVGLPTAPASWGFDTFTFVQYDVIYAKLVDETVVVSSDIYVNPTVTLVTVQYEQ